VAVTYQTKENINSRFVMRGDWWLLPIHRKADRPCSW
jgi:hypothetical protein